MRKRVLVSSRSIQLVLDRFRDRLESESIELVVPPVIQRLTEGELLTYVQDVDGVIAGDDFFTEKVLRSARRLKVISKWGTGLDSIDQKVCEELGIIVKSSPGAFTEAVADSTLGYILMIARGLREVDRDMRAGIWQKYRHPALHECTLGIIGIGKIGTAVAKRAQAFGMNVFGNDVVEKKYDWVVDLNTLLRKSDFVSLHCDLNETSQNLIGKDELAVMQPTAYLINMARGGVVDEKALVAALCDKKIMGAVLDVFSQEPLPKDSELYRLDNVLLSPHCANASPAAYEYVYANTINNLLIGLKEYENAAVY